MVGPLIFGRLGDRSGRDLLMIVALPSAALLARLRNRHVHGEGGGSERAPPRDAASYAITP
jgi:hypothetical protein